MKEYLSKHACLLGAIAVGAITPTLPAVALCETDLPEAIAAIAARPVLSRARVGIQVETLSGETIYEREGDRFFVPASTLKLLTTAAVLSEFGPDHVLRTPVLGNVNANGIATLSVIGQGDPSFQQTDLEALSQQLIQQGIRQIDVLYGDDSAFSGFAVNPNWEWEDVQAGYGAPVNALILNENEIGLSLFPSAIGQPLQVVWDDPQNEARWSIENYSTTVPSGEPEFIRVGRALGRPVLRVWGQLITGTEPETASIADPNPGQTFLDAFQTVLADQGIPVQQTRLTEGLPAARNELAVVTSPPLAELLIPTNQNSNNLYAEALLKQLSRQTSTANNATEAGIEIALTHLQELGMNPNEAIVFDGSGLARKNLITPAAMVDVLQGMARSPHAATYRNSLAEAGSNGTLRNRFQDTPVQGRLWGKSGAISRNFALAGYLEPASYPPLAFSIFLNNINERGGVARSLIDDIVLAIATLEPCRQ